jgi:hypothetical protein
MIDLSCKISNTDFQTPLGLEIFLNKKKIASWPHVTQPLTFEHQLPSSPGEYVLVFQMTNKQPSHTQIDLQGNIVKDACLVISDLIVDGFEMHQVLIHAVYEHDFNGTAPTVRQVFYNIMGCNGTVTVEFGVPVYDWLCANYTDLCYFD